MTRDDPQYKEFKKKNDKFNTLSNKEKLKILQDLAVRICKLCFDEGLDHQDFIQLLESIAEETLQAIEVLEIGKVLEN